MPPPSLRLFMQSLAIIFQRRISLRNSINSSFKKCLFNCWSFGDKWCKTAFGTNEMSVQPVLADWCQGIAKSRNGTNDSGKFFSNGARKAGVSMSLFTTHFSCGSTIIFYICVCVICGNYLFHKPDCVRVRFLAAFCGIGGFLHMHSVGVFPAGFTLASNADHYFPPPGNVPLL